MLQHALLIRGAPIIGR